VPVQKLRNIEEQPPSPVRSPADNLRAALELARLCRWLSRSATPPGVQRFASMAEAQAGRR
jgi:hypothetical protein